jgi:ribosomal protein S18 acetylase RimI-like enzyme
MNIVVSNDRINLVAIEDFSPEVLAELKHIYRSTRAHELVLTNWSEVEKQLFIDHQFSAQHAYYQKIYPQAYNFFVYFDGIIVGRLYINLFLNNNEVRIVDISLKEAYRGQLIGTTLLRSLQKMVSLQYESLSIHVEHFNPAMKLYERLGFKIVGHFNEVYKLMRWHPNQ